MNSTVDWSGLWSKVGLNSTVDWSGLWSKVGLTVPWIGLGCGQK